MHVIRELRRRWLWRPHDCPIAPKGKVNGYRDGECVCREALLTGKTVAEWRAEQGKPPALAVVGPQQLTLLIGGKP